tara:strand:+ start:22 stop:960 length:939 start_codon:yes stop_codon:yes gene_type:complete
MSRVRADKFVDRAATGAPTLTYGAEVPVGYGITGAGGINITGVATAGSFSGSLTGSATGLTGTPDITVNNITGVGATLTATTESSSTTSGALIISGGVGIAKSLNVGGNVTVGGTLTYEDVTNQDVLGIATYRQSLYVGSTEGSGAGAGISMHNTGNAIFAGIGTINTLHTGVAVTGPARGLYAEGILVESFSSVATAWNSDGNLDITGGNVIFNSANLGGTTNTLNIISTTGINTDMAVGQTLTVTGITSVNSSSSYVNALKIDGVTTPVWWNGGSAPSDGGGSGLDMYTFNIVKTGSGTYHVIGNQTKTS